MADVFRRGLGSGVCLVCLVSLGCLQVPVCMPEMSIVPAVGPGAKADEVFAFRVDVTDREEVKEGRSAATPIRAENLQLLALSRLPWSMSGTTPPQVSMTCATGWCTVGFWNYFNSLTMHSIAVRLYRPGFETIELRPGQAPYDLRWAEAPDIAAQEKALDDLLGVSPLELDRPVSELQQRRLENGTKSPAHRKALDFAAREYERLANAASRDGADAQDVVPRLFAKAQRLKKLADAR
jgi:hypothetical protein